MPRTARDKYHYGVYYISQSSDEDKVLFRNKDDREKFLSILSSVKKISGFKLYAFCVIKSKEYHLIIGTNGSDISSIMKGINIRYAMYIDDSSPIFKDRYKSILIEDKKDLISILDKIHARGIEEDTRYNSYCFYDQGIIFDDGLLDKLDLDLLTEKEDCLVSMNDCDDCIRNIEEGYIELKEIANTKGLTVEEIIADKPLRNDLIRQFRKNSTLSLKEIGKIFGGLSESSICKILTNK